MVNSSKSKTPDALVTDDDSPSLHRMGRGDFQKLLLAITQYCLPKVIFRKFTLLIRWERIPRTASRIESLNRREIAPRVLECGSPLPLFHGASHTKSMPPVTDPSHAKKRQRTAALQDASRGRGPQDVPPGFGVRQSFCRFCIGSKRHLPLTK